MATAKQIAANRRNAQRSTGPRTAAGKSISSRNAFRHGLSLPQEITTMTDIEGLARAIAGEEDNDTKMRAAVEAAVAQFDLLRIQKVRTKMLAEIDFIKANPQQLQRLLAIDRYESRARTRRRRASAKIEQNG